MPLLNNNKVGDDGSAGTGITSRDGKALVDALIKVVACYRQLASCVGGCTDSLQLRNELRQTREKAQQLAEVSRHHLTLHLRDKSLPEDERKETELLWVAFTSSLELLHLDMCKVFTVGDTFALANPAAFVQTGIQGGGSEVAARALSLPDLEAQTTPGLPDELETQEQSQLELEIGQMDSMIEDMEMKVNVMRWMVESRGPQYAEPLSCAESGSLAFFSVEEECEAEVQPTSLRTKVLVGLLLCTLPLVIATLSACIAYLS